MVETDYLTFCAVDTWWQLPLVINITREEKIENVGENPIGKPKWSSHPMRSTVIKKRAEFPSVKTSSRLKRWSSHLPKMETDALIEMIRDIHFKRASGQYLSGEWLLGQLSGNLCRTSFNIYHDPLLAASWIDILENFLNGSFSSDFHPAYFLSPGSTAPIWKNSAWAIRYRY